MSLLSIVKLWFVVVLSLSSKAAKDRAHILEGYKIALDHIDEVIKLIRASKTSEIAQAGLMEKFESF